MLDTHFIPATQSDSRRLLVMLHGLGDSVAGYLWMPDALRLPWLNYCLVNAPDEYFGGYSWFDFDGDMLPGVERSRRMLFELLDTLEGKGFAAAEITLGGFSQGCLMAIEVGCRYPQRFAGVVGISGYVCEPATLVKELSPAAQEQRFLITHGTHDPLLPIGPVREQIKSLQTAGLRIEWREFHKDHTIAGEEELGLIRSFIRAGYPE